LTCETLVTVETEKEAERVRRWCVAQGREVRMFENNRDPFYDRWVCTIS
jgi:hypothetical protein